jgi:3',5'-cyclic AMP phosphodiesterase CpdA
VSAGLFAISDLHLGHAANREALMALPPLPDDWLIVAGDVGETLPLVEFAWRVLVPRFARIIWTPGNHDLWTLPQRPAEPRGVARYEHLVALWRHHARGSVPAVAGAADRADLHAVRLLVSPGYGQRR